jgi:CRISPR/Cas system CSM-associated protein Csm3 (group 7 of RAMP superfamily)
MNRPNDNRKPEFPKPFDFVPFPARRQREQPPGHDAFRGLSGRLEYDLIVSTPLHVSSGTYSLAKDAGFQGTGIMRDHYRVTVDGERTPAVPGSTLKGSARAIVEAVTASCVSVSRRDLRAGVPRALEACQPPELCPACALFGAMSRLGRVRFVDAVQIEGGKAIYFLPQLFRPRPKGDDGRLTPLYTNDAGRFYGRKFYYHGKVAPRHAEAAPIEVLTPRSRLRASVTFESLSEPELGLLLFGLGLDHSFRPLLGAGKPLALGRVRPQATRLTLYQRDSLLSAEPADETWVGDAVVARLEQAVAAAEPLILDDQREELRRILDPRNPREAPTGMY